MPFEIIAALLLHYAGREAKEVGSHMHSNGKARLASLVER
jgi:hypothetical protein